MRIIEGKEYWTIQELFVAQFIDQSARSYADCIENKHCFSDGRFQTGYYWDCLKAYNRRTEKYCLEFLSEKQEFYILWDVLSAEQIRIPNYYQYPAESCLQLSFREYQEKADSLPEDIYFFDDTLTWCVILTHEDDGKRRYCLSIGC